MPNHITNIVKAPKEVLDSLINEEGEVDFNLIIPMPESEKDNWYSWNCNNWGCKWNAYSSYYDEEEGELIFDTAWSCPHTLLESLSEKFPDVKIEVQFADEDIGHNFGHYLLKNGWTEELEIEDGYSFACRVKGVDEDNETQDY